MPELKPCPFCGGPVQLERPLDTPGNSNEWWGVVCRNTLNRGGSCAIHQVPSRTKEAAIDRWNNRTIPADQVMVPRELLEAALKRSPAGTAEEFYAREKAICELRALLQR